MGAALIGWEDCGDEEENWFSKRELHIGRNIKNGSVSIGVGCLCTLALRCGDGVWITPKLKITGEGWIVDIYFLAERGAAHLRLSGVCAS